MVIPTRWRPAELERCLAALVTQDYTSFDVVVVDNSPGDERAREIAGRYGARYVHHPEVGLCRARNRGALVSTAEVIAYLDDDSLPQPGWLRALAAEFDDPEVMAVGARTIPLRLETEAERLFAEVRGSSYNGTSRLVVDRSTPEWFEICGFGGIGPGCNMAIRRKAFEVWPGFHERTGRGTPLHGGEDQHAFFSLVDRGYRVVYTPDAVVRHPFPPSMEALRTRYLRDLTASTAYFTMLFFEERKHRRATLKYLVEGIQGKPRVWRGAVTVRPRIVSRARAAAALLLGPLRYVQSRLVRSEV